MDIRKLWEKRDLILRMVDNRELGPIGSVLTEWSLFASPNRDEPEWFYIVKQGHKEQLVELYDISDTWQNIQEIWGEITRDITPVKPQVKESKGPGDKEES